MANVFSSVSKGKQDGCKEEGTVYNYINTAPLILLSQIQQLTKPPQFRALLSGAFPLELDLGFTTPSDANS